MRLPFLFARRYLLSRKSTNAINIISGISVFGITIGSAALLIILSVFNGFEDLLRQLIGSFKPDIQITAAEGKVFTLDSTKIQQIRDLEGVVAVARTLEEIALFEHGGAQQLGMLKGVDESFQEVISLDTALTHGKFALRDKDLYLGVVGAAIEYPLGISIQDAYLDPVKVYMPKRDKKTLSGTNPFKQRELYPAATYTVLQSDFDKYILTHIDFAQEILSYNNGEMSALELKIAPDADDAVLMPKIREIVSDSFLVKNRYQQDEAFFKITNAEKWVGFLLFAFTLVLVAFNMVGALWMLVLEKKQDIATLKAMGATDRMVRHIFLLEGILLSFLGCVIGCAIAVALCLLQQHFGLVRLEGSGEFIIDRYPVSMRLSDFILVFATVLIIGTLAAWLPAWRASRISGSLRE